jgi:hypothetical protein
MMSLMQQRIASCPYIAILLAILPAALRAEEAATSVPELQEAPITEADREHWSFSPLARPAVPKVSNETWPRTPVDRFILARLEKAGLEPLPEADRTTLLRRLSFNLTG